VDARLAAGKPGSDLLVLAGRTYLAAGDAQGAERLFRQAIDVSPAALEAYALLGRLYLSQGRLDQARQEFESVASRQSRPVAALTMAGQILLQQGQTAAARDHFERVLAIDPNAAVAANNLAWIYAEADEKLDQALQLAQTAVAALPKSAEARDTLGWVYYKRKAPQLAVSALERCVAQEAGNPVYHYHLGLAYALAGDRARARQALERALALNGTFAGADDARRVLAGLAG
jgi:tetratricopeptide (TPR) repeat protein